jgi:HEPN domain-containing protein
MKKEEIKNSAQTFYYFAEQDLAAAKLLLASDEIDIQLIMFHLQQSVEKLLKAILSHLQVEITRTHDIERLIVICRDNGVNLPAFVEDLADLSLFAVEGRYALIHDDMYDAEEFVRAVENLKDFAVNLHDAKRIEKPES